MRSGSQKQAVRKRDEKGEKPVKKNRIIYAILWFVSLAGISFYGGPVSYGFFALLTLIPLVSFIYLLAVMLFFRIYQELDSKNLVADHVVPFYFTLMNEFFFGFASIRVRFYSSFSTISGLDDGIEYELLPKTGIQKQTSLVCKYRGEYEVGIKRVEMQDYLRLIRLSYQNREALRVVVKPNLAELTQLRGVDFADVFSRDSLHQQTEPDAVVRRYEQGDDLRWINWKASARSGELLSRRLTGEEREGVALLMGTYRGSKDPLEYLPVENKLLEATLALALFFAKKKIPVQAMHLAEGLVEKSLLGLEQFDSYYATLSGVEFREEYAEARFLEAASSRRELFDVRTAFLVLQEWTDAAEGMVRLLSENHVYAVVYLIQNEEPKELSGWNIPRAKLFRIETDADLGEVMG